MVKVKTGCIKVESVIKSADGPLVVYQVDLRAKYAEIYGYVDGNTVDLCAGDMTFNMEASDESTLITFPGLIVAAECSQYTLTVVMAGAKPIYEAAEFEEVCPKCGGSGRVWDGDPLGSADSACPQGCLPGSEGDDS